MGAGIKIPQNEKTKHKWDIQEKGHPFILCKSQFNDRSYRVHGTNLWVADVLALIEMYINMIQTICHLYCNSEQCLFFKTIPHQVQEIRVDNKTFHGINKPKDIQIYPNSIFRDQYKPGYRLIMLHLRTGGSGQPTKLALRTPKNVIKWDKVKKTLLHELAHTMCNHCVYYEEKNHLKDFDAAEKIIKGIANDPNVKSIEREIIKIYNMIKNSNYYA
jgi:hypothetical protein